MSRLPASIAPGINDEPTGAPPPRAARQAAPHAAATTATATTTPSTGLPGMPPPSAWHPAAAAPAVRSAAARPAPPTTPLDANVSALDALQPGSLASGVAILSEQEVMSGVEQDDLRLPFAVLLVALAASIAIQAGSAWTELGGLGAAMIAVGAIVSVCFGILVNTPSAVIVGKMFGEDYGTLPSLVVRVAAVCAAQGLLGAFLGGFLALLLGLPVFIGFAVWLIGMDFFQAFVLAVVATAANILLGALLVGSIGAMMFAGM